MFLLDTVILSELRKRQRDRHVLAWFRSVQLADLFLSSITIAEIEIGIGRQQRVSPTFAAELTQWLDVTLRIYGDRILPVSVAIARRWGRLAGELGNESLDLAIAATALEHGLIVATRNVSDFVPTGAQVLNPFEPHRSRRGR
jgi:predicted nucleic acid-binding protein